MSRPNGTRQGGVGFISQFIVMIRDMIGARDAWTPGPLAAANPQAFWIRGLTGNGFAPK